MDCFMWTVPKYRSSNVYTRNYLSHRTVQYECTCVFSSRSDKCCTKTALLKTIPRLTNHDSVFVELSDTTTSLGSSTRLFYGSRACLLCPARQRSEITSTTFGTHSHISAHSVADFSASRSTSRVAHSFGRGKLYICLSNKCFKCIQRICCVTDVRP